MRILSEVYGVDTLCEYPRRARLYEIKIEFQGQIYTARHMAESIESLERNVCLHNSIKASVQQQVMGEISKALFGN